MHVSDSHQEPRERLALVLSDYGMQRMHARVLAALLTTDRETLTQAELAEELDAAVGSVSAALKQAIVIGAVERVHAPGSRREHYRLHEHASARLFGRQNQVIEAVLSAAREARDSVEAGGAAHRRLTNMCDFYDFLLAEMPALIERWLASRP